jgi:lipopolysaccharide export system permease protein
MILFPIHQRYILWRITGIALLVILSLTGVAWLIMTLRNLEYISTYGIDIFAFLRLSSLQLPLALWYTVPLALFVSVLLVYHRLTVDSEIVVMRAAGLSTYRIIYPALIFSLIMVLVGYAISFFLMPAAFSQFKKEQERIRSEGISVILQERVFIPIPGRKTLYIRDRSDDGRWFNVMLHDENDPNQTVTFLAEQVEPSKGEHGAQLKLINGIHQIYDKQKRAVMLGGAFDEYIYYLNLDSGMGTGGRNKKPEERTISELFDPPPEDIDKSLMLRAHGHHRLSWPLLNILVTMLALMAYMTSEFRRVAGTGKLILVSVLAAVSMVVAMSFGFVITQMPVLSWLIYVVILGSSFICFVILLRQDTVQDMPIEAYENMEVV